MSNKKIIITIAREFGTNGHEMGLLLSERLGLPFYDKDILTKAAYETGVDYDKVKEVVYKLPDGKEVKLKDEFYEIGEVFEHPELVGKAMGGFARELCNSIYYADKEKKKEICTDIVVTGGNSLVKGFLKRFTEEAKDCLSGRYEKRINIVDVPDRLYAQWIGASICSYRPLFNTFCTTRQEYDEYGPSVMHCKPIMF